MNNYSPVDQLWNYIRYFHLVRFPLVSLKKRKKNLIVYHIFFINSDFLNFPLVTFRTYWMIPLGCGTSFLRI